MYHGEYTLQETVILTQLNLNMQARDLERMEMLGLPSVKFLITRIIDNGQHGNYS